MNLQKHNNKKKTLPIKIPSAVLSKSVLNFCRTRSLNGPFGGEFGTKRKERNHCNFTGATGLQKTNSADSISMAMSTTAPGGGR